MSTRSMRDAFTDVVTGALDRDARVALVLADIGVARFEENGAIARNPGRVVNVGIREQALIGVAAGMALEGFRPVVHSYAPFLVERPFEQVKLDLGHQDVGAVLVSIGASYDAAEEGRTHQSPGDVALLDTLPEWEIHVPGHADEAERLLEDAIDGDGRVYVRFTEESNAEPHAVGCLSVVRDGGPTAPLVLALGPTLDAVLDATADLEVKIAYTATARPLDRSGLRDAATGVDVVLVEPMLAGTSAAALTAALGDRAHRVLALGVGNAELRRYGAGADHRVLHGLDAAGVRRSLDAFLRAA